MHKCCFISMVTHCKTIDIRVTPFTLFYSIHCQKTHRDTFRALSFLILVSPTRFTRASLYSNLFPRHSNEVSVHSISRSSSWIGRWLSRDISRDINKELIFYLDALSGKNIQTWQGYMMYVYASVNLTGERRHFLGLQILSPSNVTLNAVVGQHLPLVKVLLRIYAGFVSNLAVFFRAFI